MRNIGVISVFLVLLYACPSDEQQEIPGISEAAALFQDSPAEYGPSVLWGWQGPVGKQEGSLHAQINPEPDGWETKVISIGKTP